MAGKPLYVLSFDGGGVRGLTSLLILESLMEQLSVSSGQDTVPLPCEFFDLICGTSTGGLNALMLGRLRMSVRDAIKYYLVFSEKTFGKKTTRGDATYDANVLAECIKDIAEKLGEEGGRNAPLKDPRVGQKGCCHTFVVAVTQANADSVPEIFRSYPTKSKFAAKCTIWEAGRATTAMIPFFDPIKIGSPPVKYIDGAFSGGNNPSRIARDEVRDVFPDRPIGCFLSLGTGVPDVVAVKGSEVRIAEACKKILESCEGVENAVRREFRRDTEGQTNPYFRFSVDRGLGNIHFDEWKRVDDLTGITGGYMRYDKQEERVEKCVVVLKARVPEISAEKANDEGDLEARVNQLRQPADGGGSVEARFGRLRNVRQLEPPR